MKTVFYRAAEDMFSSMVQDSATGCCVAIAWNNPRRDEMIFFRGLYDEPSAFRSFWWKTGPWDYESRILALLLADILWREAHPPKRKKRKTLRLNPYKQTNAGRNGVLDGDPW